MTRPFIAAAAAVLLAACGGDDSRSSGEGGEDRSFVEGCEIFGVYAQNRWAPLGASVRAEPDVLSEKLQPSFAGNEVIAVDGWIETGMPVYPKNSYPWNSDVWYHLATREGWVNFAAVRYGPTVPDPAATSNYGGEPAPLPPDCEGEYIP